MIYHNSYANTMFAEKLFICSLLMAALVVTAGLSQESVADEGFGNTLNTTDNDEHSSIQSLTFAKDMKIKDALRFLSAKYQKNIVPTNNVDGSVVITNLYDVTFEEVMDAILGHSYKYEEVGNFIWVYTAEEYTKIKADKSRMIHKVFTLYYTSAAETLKLVTPVLSTSGIIQGSTAAEAGISADDDVGSGVGGDSMALNDVVVIYDYPENILKAESIINSIDIRPQQVLVEATILSATLTEKTMLGIDWNTLNGVSISDISGIGTGAQDGLSTGSFAAKVTTGGLSVGITSDHISALIRALETVTDITIHANPKILALNKQVGTVFIGEKLGYRESTSVTSSGTETKGEVKFLDTGTKLSFRPYIANDGYVRMDIYPKDSSAELNADDVPTETTAELTTNIMVKDGMTVVIGGLFRDTVTTSKSQIPVIGDLPFVGAAFRGTSDETVRQEIIVMLTPHIIKDPSELPGESLAEDISRKRTGAKDGIQWVSKSRLAEDHYAKAAEYYIAGDNTSALDKVNHALELRPTYLEAIRLKERLLDGMISGSSNNIERKILADIERKDSHKWLRRRGTAGGKIEDVK